MITSTLHGSEFRNFFKLYIFPVPNGTKNYTKFQPQNIIIHETVIYPLLRHFLGQKRKEPEFSGVRNF